MEKISNEKILHGLNHFKYRERHWNIYKEEDPIQFYTDDYMVVLSVGEAIRDLKVLAFDWLEENAKLGYQKKHDASLLESIMDLAIEMEANK